MIITLLLLIFVTGAVCSWLTLNNGIVIVTWLGYEAKTDMVTSFLIVIIFAFASFLFLHLVTRILAIRFPSLLKLFFKKSYSKKLEGIIHKHWQGFDGLTDLLLAYETKDEKSVELAQKKVNKYIKNARLNSFLLAKINYDQQNFLEAEKYFSKIKNNDHAKALAFKSHLKLSLKNNDRVAAIAYAKQTLSLISDEETALLLLSLYKRNGLWQEAKLLIKEHNLNQSQLANSADNIVINTSLALAAYRKKNFFLAIKLAKLALKQDDGFLPANEILLKSLIKIGFSFKASWMIKRLWKKHPHILLVQIYDLINRKAPARVRINLVKKLIAIKTISAGDNQIKDLALATVAFRANDFVLAQQLLQKITVHNNNPYAIKMLIKCYKLNSHNITSDELQKYELLKNQAIYNCTICDNVTNNWSAKCHSCGSYDSFDWNL